MASAVEVSKQLPVVTNNLLTLGEREIGISQTRDIIPTSHSLDSAYLSWLSVRSIEGTGFGGYFVGLDNPQQEIEHSIDRLDASLNSTKILKGWSRLHHMVTLLQDEVEVKNDRQASEYLDCYAELNCIFASTIARLRSNLLNNPRGQKFRQQTATLVHHTGPNILYPQIDEDSLPNQHSYRLPFRETVEEIILFKQLVELNTGSTDKIDIRNPWSFLPHLGKLGHPLTRTTLKYLQIIRS